MPVVTVAIVILLVGSLIVPASSFTTARVDRGSTFEVVADAQAIHNLDVAQAATIGQTSRLVTVTNNLGVDVSIEVRLRPDSTGKGDLVVGNTTVGDEASFSLPAGQSTVVELRVPSDATLDGERAYFHVNASGDGVTVTAPDRSISLTA